MSSITGRECEKDLDDCTPRKPCICSWTPLPCRAFKSPGKNPLGKQKQSGNDGESANEAWVGLGLGLGGTGALGTEGGVLCWAGLGVNRGQMRWLQPGRKECVGHGRFTGGHLHVLPTWGPAPCLTTPPLWETNIGVLMTAPPPPDQHQLLLDRGRVLLTISLAKYTHWTTFDDQKLTLPP